MWSIGIEPVTDLVTDLVDAGGGFTQADMEDEVSMVNHRLRVVLLWHLTHSVSSSAEGAWLEAAGDGRSGFALRSNRRPTDRCDLACDVSRTGSFLPARYRSQLRDSAALPAPELARGEPVVCSELSVEVGQVAVADALVDRRHGQVGLPEQFAGLGQPEPSDRVAEGRPVTRLKYIEKADSDMPIR